MQTSGVSRRENVAAYLTGGLFRQHRYIQSYITTPTRRTSTSSKTLSKTGHWTRPQVRIKLGHSHHWRWNGKMEINTQALTSCEVAADGGAVSLGFVDANGKPATIRLSLNQVGALAMTLPGLIDKALQKRFGDQSLRYAYPLESWMVEQSTDPTQSMVTLRTVDGFSVCFSIPRQQQSELGEALVAQPASKAPLRAH